MKANACFEQPVDRQSAAPSPSHGVSRLFTSPQDALTPPANARPTTVSGVRRSPFRKLAATFGSAESAAHGGGACTISQVIR